MSYFLHTRRSIIKRCRILMFLWLLAVLLLLRNYVPWKQYRKKWKITGLKRKLGCKILAKCLRALKCFFLLKRIQIIKCQQCTYFYVVQNKISEILHSVIGFCVTLYETIPEMHPWFVMTRITIIRGSTSTAKPTTIRTNLAKQYGAFYIYFI